MPDQPADPIHYDMKIPPEPDKTQQGPDAERPAPEDNTSHSDSAKDTNVVRGDDKPQTGRHGG